MNNERDNYDPLDALKGQATPTPEATAKARAMQAAMTEFQQQFQQATPAAKPANFFSRFRQGFIQRLRPTANFPNSRTEDMTSTPQKFWISSLATCSVLILGIFYWRQHAPVPNTNPEPSLVVDTSAERQKQENNVKGDYYQPANTLEPQGSRQEAGAMTEPALELAAPQKEVIAGSVRVDNEAYVPAPASAPAIASAALAKREAPPASTAEYRDRFTTFKDNSVTAVSAAPVSTFSIDVDTASYSFSRRAINSGHLPAKDAVRTEEFINYFSYEYPLPDSRKTPFKPSITLLDSPWKAGNKLIHIGIKGYQLPANEIPRSNLVFLLDVSGSMASPDKLPLVQQSMAMLLDNLKPDDTVAIVVYAGAAGTVLPPTPVKNKTKILSAINNLTPGGATAGAEGIQLAYQLAEANFNPKAVNRIILATDGDFNVGPTGDSELKDYVERKREKGIFLSVLGFGQGNYQDAMMQTLAQNGNGTAAYIDTLSEAQKVLVHEATSTLFPIASDVKIQVEFNPATVAEYRLIGYETRALNREDFNNDKIDAGEIGAGHSVTAIYEITPANTGNPLIEPSRYENKKPVKTRDEYGFLRIRYKLPGESKSQLIEEAIPVQKKVRVEFQREAEFATAVAGFAQLLRGGRYMENFTHENVIELAQKNKGEDEFGYRSEFIQLVRKARVAKEM